MKSSKDGLTNKDLEKLGLSSEDLKRAERDQLVSHGRRERLAPKVCSDCEKENKPGATICSHCGKPI